MIFIQIKFQLWQVFFNALHLFWSAMYHIHQEAPQKWVSILKISNLLSLGLIRKLYCLNITFYQYNNTVLDLIPSITLVYLNRSVFFNNTQLISFLLSSLFMYSLETPEHFSHVSNSSTWQDAVKTWMFHYCLKTFWGIKI